MPDKEIPGIADLCENTILQGLVDHQKLRDGEQRIRYLLEVRVGEKLLADFQQIYESFGFEDVEFPEDLFMEEVLGENGDAIEASKRTYLSTKGSEVFKQARGAACAEQLSRVSLKVYPGSEEVEEIDRGGWREPELRSLQARLKMRMKKSETVLLEEVEGEVDRKASEIIADTRNQIGIQREAIGIEPDKGLITRDQIGGALTGNVTARINKLRGAREPWQRVYEIFPSVKQAIADRSGREEENRFGEFCQTFSMKISDESEIEGSIRRNTREHRRYNESLDRFVTQYYPATFRRVIEAHAGMAPQSERASFSSRLQGYEGSVGADLKGRMKELLRGDLDTAMNAVAAEQFRTYFEVLADSSWELVNKEDEELGEIIRRYEMGDEKGKKLTIRTFDDCDREPKTKTSISQNGYNREELLERNEIETALAKDDRKNEDKSVALHDVTEPVKPKEEGTIRS